MKPFDVIAELYEVYDVGRTFDEDIAAHISNGYVFSTPEFFLMGRPVDRFADMKSIDDPWYPFPMERQNTWLVYAFAGHSQNLLTFMPYPLTWLAWQRRGNPLRIYDLQQAKRICASMTRSGTTLFAHV